MWELNLTNGQFATPWPPCTPLTSAMTPGLSFKSSTLYSYALTPFPARLPPSYRFAASQQTPFILRVIFMGPLMYLATLRLIWESGNLTPYAALLLTAMTVLALTPVAACKILNTRYFGWRDALLTLHYTIHHCLAPRALVQLGVSYREQLTFQHPLGFAIALLFCRSVPWHSINPLMYRLRFRTFAVAQTALVLLSLPFELDSCTWAAAHNPRTAAVAFSSAARWGHRLASSGLPLTAVHPLGSPTPQDPAFLRDCNLVTSFTFIFLGVFLNGALLWWLERRSWDTYVNVSTPAATIAWPEGPPQQMLESALEELRFREGCKLKPERWLDDLHLAGCVVLAAVILWQALDLVV